MVDESDGGVADEEVADEGVGARGIDDGCLVAGAEEDGEGDAAFLVDCAGVGVGVVEPGGVGFDGVALDAAECRVLDNDWNERD